MLGGKLEMNFGIKKRSPWFTAIVLVAVGVFIFAVGSVAISYTESNFTVRATGGAIEVPYEKISEIEYRESNDNGRRSFGINTMKINSGNFTNEEFGGYTLYAYTAVKPVIVVHHSDDMVLVFNLKTVEETKNAYETLRDYWGK